MKCLPRTVSSLDDFKAMCSQIHLEFAANFGDTSVPFIYEFATDATDLVEKLHWLSIATARLNDDAAVWELYWCDGCAETHPDFPLHVRLCE